MARGSQLPFITPIFFKPGGKDSFRLIFQILTPNNCHSHILAIGAALSAFYGRIIRCLYGQHPVIVLVSEEKGVGKTFAMKSCLWAVSSLQHIFNNMSSAEYIMSKAAGTSLLIGLEDTHSVAKEEKLFVGIFDGAWSGTRTHGAREPIAEFMVSTNLTERTERHADHCLFIKFSKWDHLIAAEEKNELSRKFKKVVSDGQDSLSPLDYVASHSSYIFSNLYKSRLDENCSLVQQAMSCKARTARNYAFALNMVELLFDQFPEEFATLEMTWESFKQFLISSLLPSTKNLHAEKEDHHKLVDEFLKALLIHSSDWNVSQVIF